MVPPEESIMFKWLTLMVRNSGREAVTHTQSWEGPHTYRGPPSWQMGKLRFQDSQRTLSRSQNSFITIVKRNPWDRSGFHTVHLILTLDCVSNWTWVQGSRLLRAWPQLHRPCFRFSFCFLCAMGTWTSDSTFLWASILSSCNLSHICAVKIK